MILLCYYYFGKYNLRPHNKADVVRNDAIIYRGPLFQVSFFLFHRDGTVQIGDRVLSVNGRELAGCSLIQAQKWIRETDKLTPFKIKIVKNVNLK